MESNCQIYSASFFFFSCWDYDGIFICLAHNTKKQKHKPRTCIHKERRRGRGRVTFAVSYVASTGAAYNNKNNKNLASCTHMTHAHIDRQIDRWTHRQTDSTVFGYSMYRVICKSGSTYLFKRLSRAKLPIPDALACCCF